MTKLHELLAVESNLEGQAGKTRTELMKTFQIYFLKLALRSNQTKRASRRLSIVKTKLEEACFFAKKAMANQKENQQS
jgi:hypothetical protein